MKEITESEKIMKDPMELLKDYQTQYIEFCNIDDFNLEAKAKRIPAEKHFWVARLIDAKIERERLLKRRKTLLSDLEGKLRNDKEFSFNEYEIKKKANVMLNDEKIGEQLRGYDFLVEYLEKLVSCVNFIAQDIKNIVMLKQLEETG